jgi:hypothetical protein
VLVVRGLSLSVVFHVLLFTGVIYSTKLSLALLKARQRDIKAMGTIAVDLASPYKHTDTAMKLGEDKKDLPPPLVGEKAPPEDSPVLKERNKTKEAEKKKELKKEALKKTKEDIKNILSKLRSDANKEDNRPKPKENNFPKSKQGEKNATGTGGISLRTLSPAEQALQSAMRRYFEMADANNFRKKNPNTRGYLQIKLVGVGHQFEIASLDLYQTTGFGTLDRSCEIAIRKALDSEVFSNDVIRELNGKEAIITCEP